MAKNLIWGLILTRLAQIWVPIIFFVGFTSTSSYTLFQAIIFQAMQCPGKQILSLILVRLDQI